MRLLRPFFKRFMRHRSQLILFSCLSVVCLVATAVLATQVFLRLDAYASSNDDNIEWTMAQIEVEQIKLLNALERLDAPTPRKVREVRARFDSLYSRIFTLTNSQTYQKAMADSAIEKPLDDIRATLQSMIPIIDAGDDALVARRDTLLDAVETMTPDIRRVALAGVTIDADRNDAERATLSRKLLQLTALSVLLVIALLSIMVLLWRLYRVHRARAMENRITLNRLATILNTSADAVLVLRPDGTIVDTNDTANRLFGLSGAGLATDTRPANVADILLTPAEDGAPGPVSGADLTAACRGGPSRIEQLTARRADGQTFPVELSANLASRSGDEVCVCFLRDISDQLAAQEKIKAARDKALATERTKAIFLARISHEMRTPLHGILGTLDLLQQTTLTAEQARYAQVLETSGHILLGQIEDAMGMTRSGDPQLSLSPSAFDLDQLLEDLTLGQRSKAQARGTTLEIAPMDAPLGTVFGDPDRVQQVLLNLLSNAIKATENGEILIEVCRLEGPDGQPDMVEFQISDTGTGISKRDLARIFDDFVRLGTSGAEAAQGAGLGLGIVRTLVDLMGGRIGAESIEGEGSLFWVRLPLPRVRPPEITPAEDSPATEPAGPGLDVLLVEDNATNRFVLESMLVLDGHTVTLAHGGVEGVECAKAEPFDLIIMDINMPGLDGIEATRRIRQAEDGTHHPRIAALTAYFSEADRARFAAAGIDDIWTKPLALADLRKRLAQIEPSRHTDVAPARADAEVPEKDDLPRTLADLQAIVAPEKLQNLVRDFIEETDAMLDDRAAQGLATDQATAARIHKLAGSTAVLGAAQAHAQLGRAEGAARRDDPEGLRSALDAFQDGWPALRATLAEAVGLTPVRDTA